MLFLVGRLKYQYLDVTKDIALTWENFFTNLKLYPFMYKGIVENRSYNDMIEAGFL